MKYANKIRKQPLGMLCRTSIPKKKEKSLRNTVLQIMCANGTFVNPIFIRGFNRKLQIAISSLIYKQF